MYVNNISLDTSDVINIFNKKLRHMLDKSFYFGFNSKLSGVLRENMYEKLVYLFKSLMDNIDFSNNIFLIKNTSIELLEHSINTALYSGIVASYMKLPEDDIKNLLMGATFHDIGKIFDKDGKGLKNTIFSSDDDGSISSHVLKGREHIDRFSEISEEAKRIILEHHEYYDGTGKPNGLNFEKTLLLSRIVTMADAFDAMSSKHEKEGVFAPYDFVEYVMAYSGTMFDHKIVKIFFKKIIPYPIGSLVRLSDDRIGVVEKIPDDFLFRPVIKIVKQLATRIIMEEIPLMENPSLTVKAILEKTPNPSVQSYLKNGYN